MKKLIILASIFCLAFNVAASDKGLCAIEFNKNEFFGDIKTYNLNPTRIELQPSIFSNRFAIIEDQDGDVLEIFNSEDKKFYEYVDSLKTPHTVKLTDIRILKRYIHSKTYLNVRIENVESDIPLVDDQGMSLKVALAKRTRLICEN